MAHSDQAIAGTPTPTQARGGINLTGNQWKVLWCCALAGMLETMDLYLIGFVLADITGPWGLSYGVSAAILLASGVGAIFGALTWGHIADSIGRKKAFLITILICSLSSIALAFTPSGDWVFLAIVRTILGFGAGGFFLFIMLVQEFAPAANRGMVSGIVSTAAASGLMLGALAGSFLMPILGWRGMFALGVLPALAGILAFYLMPESPRWALAKGYVEQGRKALRWALGENADIEPIVQAYSKVEKQPGWGEVFKLPRSLIVGTVVNYCVVTGFYGAVLWAPTLIGQVLHLESSEASKVMLGISIAGLCSRFLTGLLADAVGRRTCGAFSAAAAAICLVLAALVAHGDLLSREMFWLPFGAALVLADSSFAVLALYTSELWPSKLRGRGSGINYGIGGIGKIMGPLGLAVAVGSTNMIRPAATVDSIVPAFGYLAIMFGVAALFYVFVARETRGKTFEEIDNKSSA
ncbi:MAG: MFS transporter [Caulobacterales bacterium]|nr:MFS transporter [Caulobacterales bacterium]